MFKAVTKEQAAEYDEETLELYAKRPSDPRQSYVYRVSERKYRLDLPVIVSEDNEYIKELENKFFAQ